MTYSTLIVRAAAMIMAGSLFVLAGCGTGDSSVSGTGDSSGSGDGGIGAVQNLEIVATSDGLAFRIQWDAPFGNPALDGYRVVFDPFVGPNEILADLTTNTAIVHDPGLGVHGNYIVTPVAPDGTEGESDQRTVRGTVPDGAPRIQDPHTNDAIGAVGSYGIGFQDNVFKEYEFPSIAGDRIALYATNFADGVDPPLYLASAELIRDTPADQSVLGPIDFKGCLIKDAGTGPVDYAPALDSTYTDHAEAIVGHHYAIYDPVGQYYYVVSVLEVGAIPGEVRLGTWVRGEFPRSRIIEFTEYSEVPNDVPVLVTWTPLVLVPNVQGVIAVQIPPPPCASDLSFDLSVNLPIVASANEIVIPAGQFKALVDITGSLSGVNRIRVVGNGCHSVTALFDLAVHPAGERLLRGFAGGVSGDAGAVATLDIELEYRDESSAVMIAKAAYWNVIYTESSPGDFSASVTAKSQDQRATGLFDGPGGQYDWTLEPFTDAEYTGELIGTFKLIRPDGTLETFDYALPSK